MEELHICSHGSGIGPYYTEFSDVKLIHCCWGRFGEGNGYFLWNGGEICIRDASEFEPNEEKSNLGSSYWGIEYFDEQSPLSY